MSTIRVEIPYHLRNLAQVDGEIALEVAGRSRCGRCWTHSRHVTLCCAGTIREHDTLKRRPFLRFFACEEDLSHQSPDAPLPEAVADGREPLLIIGAIAGG